MEKIQELLPHQKYAFCFVPISPLRAASDDRSEIVSQVLFGEIVEIKSFGKPWIQIETLHDGYQGFADIKQFIPLTEKEMRRWFDEHEIVQGIFAELQTPWGNQWITSGAYANAGTFSIGNLSFCLQEQSFGNRSITSISNAFLNTPYLWGGRSPFGIDCSGFTQLVFRQLEKNLPRDAYQQAELGLDVAFDEKEVGDLAFFGKTKEKITHVGIVLENNQIIHASGRVRVDVFSENGIINSDNDELSHTYISLRRLL